jgi:16S rRNA (guanine966-N2)-methyltransferase
VRIVGGKWAGRDLVSPGARVRPTAEEVRAAWLDALGLRLAGATVLDLFAGSGALGLEALSRGAVSVDFVENGPASLHALKANIAALRVPDQCRVFKKDALTFASSLPAGRYTIAFADPPYGSGVLDRLVELWSATPFATVLAVEHSADHELPGAGRRYLFDRTAITFLPSTAVPAQRTRAPAPPRDRTRPRPPRRRR